MPTEPAKKTVGGAACITGGFDDRTPSRATAQQPVDECKRMAGVCAPGGGSFFTTGSGRVDTRRPENMEAMFRAFGNHGKY